MSDVQKLAQAVLSGSHRAVARAISAVEDRAPYAADLLRALFASSGKSYLVGVTGAAGTGKSTLVDRLAVWFRSQGSRVGIIAVDPTSPFSGGALLGDRIRMQDLSADPGIFIRSMATRGQMGGLSSAADDAAVILDAAGYELILVETVGAGQDEIDIVRMAHATALVLAPGLGDEVQVNKAGIMEIGDFFVLNKADHAGADRAEADLRSMLADRSRPDGWEIPLVLTVATEGRGIEALGEAILRFRERSAEAWSERRLEKERCRLTNLILRRMRDRLQPLLLSAKMRDYVREIAERRRDPYSVTDEILAAQSRWAE